MAVEAVEAVEAVSPTPWEDALEPLPYFSPDALVVCVYEFYHSYFGDGNQEF